MAKVLKTFAITSFYLQSQLNFSFWEGCATATHVTTSASLSVVVCQSISCCDIHSLLSCGGAFLKFLFLLRWLCKLFDKALVCAWACGALAMCLQNTWACC